MYKSLAMLLSSSLILSGCAYDGQTNNVKKTNYDSVTSPTYQSRQAIADQTCESQYKQERQNFLSAVQTSIARGRMQPDMAKAPLDSFRAEVNAAYNTVVMRCKTHTHCLEVKFYDEAACYMAASDRKDAERRFADLSARLREIERTFDTQHVRAKKPGPITKVHVDTTVTQRNDQSQTNDQTNDMQVGDDIADQDVLIMCGDAKNLLKRQCREQ